MTYVYQFPLYALTCAVLLFVKSVTSFHKRLPQNVKYSNVKPYCFAQSRCSSNTLSTANASIGGHIKDTDPIEVDDTIRVRIWRALSPGEEMSLSQLSAAVQSLSTNNPDQQDQPPLSQSDLRHHLKHVERQARTISNKSIEWRKRRGLIPDSNDGDDVVRKRDNKLRIRYRRDKKKRNHLYVRLG